MARGTSLMISNLVESFWAEQAIMKMETGEMKWGRIRRQLQPTFSRKTSWWRASWNSVGKKQKDGVKKRERIVDKEKNFWRKRGNRWGKTEGIIEKKEKNVLYRVLGIVGSFPTHHQRILFTRHFRLLYPLFLHIIVLSTVINNSLESLGFALSGAAPGRIVVQIRCTRPLRLIRIVWNVEIAVRYVTHLRRRSDHDGGLRFLRGCKQAESATSFLLASCYYIDGDGPKSPGWPAVKYITVNCVESRSGLTAEDNLPAQVASKLTAVRSIPTDRCASIKIADGYESCAVTNCVQHALVDDNEYRKSGVNFWKRNAS